MRKAGYFKHILKFKRPGGTSRGTLHEKPSWFILLRENDKEGIGECGLLPGLSIDDRPGYAEKLRETLRNWEAGIAENLQEWPSIRFGMEMAEKSLAARDKWELFSSTFTHGTNGIPTNGLIWMGSVEFMKEQIKSKLDQGFSCLKMKIGAIEFDQELAILKSIRKDYFSAELELRVDANGAFSPDEALGKINQLAEIEVRSIEQPIRAGQWEEMAELCEKTTLDIALDEELIGVVARDEKKKLIETIRPQAVVLKPSLLGGWEASEEWIEVATVNGAYWWATSALESNVGLNAIAQFTFMHNPTIFQGLGTGQLFENNIKSALSLDGEKLFYHPETPWEFPYSL